MLQLCWSKHRHAFIHWNTGYKESHSSRDEEYVYVYRDKKGWLEGESCKAVMVHHWLKKRSIFGHFFWLLSANTAFKPALLCSISLRLFSKVCTTNFFSCSACLSFSVHTPCPHVHIQSIANLSFYHFWGWYAFFFHPMFFSDCSFQCTFCRPLQFCLLQWW